MRAIVREASDNTLRVIEVASTCYDKEESTFILTDTTGCEYEIKMEQIVANQAMEELFSDGKTDLRLYGAEIFDSDD